MLINYLSVFGLFLTIVAFCLSIWQSLEAKAHAKALSNIADALSTKYIGAYPEYMMSISDMLSKAKNEIIIVCSLPIHGIYNAHDSWLKMKHVLEKALSPDSDIIVSCVFADKNNRASLIANQYLDVKSKWEEWLLMPENQRKIQKYLNMFSKGVSVSELSFDDLIALFEKISMH